MDIVIPGHRIKTFTRSLASINKIGDELAIHGTQTSLKLSSISASRSAFCLFTFDPTFFSRYRITVRSDAGDDSVAIQLQILGKTLHDIFKQKAVSSAHRVTLSIPASDFEKAKAYPRSREVSGECRLTITIYCPHGVKKTYKLTYAAVPCMIALANVDDCENKVTVSPRTLKEWTDHFMLGKMGTDEITLWCRKDSCKIRSFEGENEAELNRGGSGSSAALMRQTISTTLTVATDEFREYAMSMDEALITVSLKEFKAIIEYTVGVGSDVDLHFSRGGEPMLAVLETDAVAIQFVLSTNADDPAGIKKEQDVKPNLKQMKLSSAAPSRAPTNTRQSASSATTSVSKTGSAAKPLFKPPDDDEQDLSLQRRQHGSEDDEALWNDLDTADPTFSQVAIDLEESASQDPRRYSKVEQEDDATDYSLDLDPQRSKYPVTSTAPKISAHAPPPKRAEIIDMSLDDDEDDSTTMQSMAGLSRNPRKNWKLGVT